MKISPARSAAYDILFKIETERAYSSALLAKYEPELSPVDRGLCHEIVLGVLRRKLLIDRYIDIFANDRKLDIEIRTILRMGVFQLFCLDRVPGYAAVNESVAMAQRARKSSARGLVNAVLRSAIRQKPPLVFKNEIERISVETSHPVWLIDRWQSQVGLETAEKLARSNNETPPVTFRRTMKGRLAQLPGDAVESEAVPGCFVAHLFSPDLQDLADRGLIYFQDEASQMVANAVGLRSGERFLDVCASPGGKTTAIALCAAETGKSSDVQIVAGDLTWRRVQLLRDTCAKQGAESVRIVQYDAARGLPFGDETFDYVLVDAPCSGTGTIRHNPEIRYFLEPGDILRMREMQLAIMTNAAKTVRLGGRLVYSTCSLEIEENENVCANILSASADWRATEPNVPRRFLTKEGFARTFPHRDGLDGFFVATFRRA